MPVLRKDWDLKTEPRLITVQGRQLHKPTVHYASTGTAKVGGDAGWNLLSHRFRLPKRLPKWTYLILSPPSENNKIHPIMHEFGRVIQQTGIAVIPPTEPFTALSATRLEDMAIKLDEYLKTAFEEGVMLIFVVLPSPNTPYYNIVKRLGDAKYGIATICMNVKKLTKTSGQDQYLRNISMKVNLKVGGSNHVVGTEQLRLISPDDTMIVGIDVTHPSPGSSSFAPSIAAMVASVDNALGQWPAILSSQNTARQEMVSGLTGMLESRLRLWGTRHNNSLPENILVYRDGVSEGQYKLVIDNELPALRKACKEVYGESYKEGHKPRLTIIVVGKRHHSRFYPTDPKNAHVSGNQKDPDNIRKGNTKAGTVVDRGVTEGQNWDFFLQAHSPIKGTARPAHQYVLLDEIFRSKYASMKIPGYNNVADVVEEVTQALCYIFGRATRAVSVCTPAYYADLACERARCYFDNLYSPAAQGIGAGSRPDIMSLASNGNVPIHERLKDSMFYI
ncbi:hypothetical protein SLS62_005418 [Diatrype stigma]|uniref:Piwi domain-containing protein n=1 Tax=Diatrype stigma TaxID=117547 RepID=A0AAN9UP86_9PEZI